MKWPIAASVSRGWAIGKTGSQGGARRIDCYCWTNIFKLLMQKLYEAAVPAGTWN